MKGKNYVYCGICGEEYNSYGRKHKCDKDVLKQILANLKADNEVVAAGDGSRSPEGEIRAINDLEKLEKAIKAAK